MGKKNGRKAAEILGLDPEADGLTSPLEGKSLPRIVVIIAIAIAIPGGIYVLAVLVILPLIARFMLRRANKRAQAGNYERAINNATAAVRASRGSARALVQRGELYLKHGDLEAALADAEKAIEKKPKLEDGYYLRARVYDRQEVYAEALADYMAYYNRIRNKRTGQAEHALERIRSLGGDM